MIYTFQQLLYLPEWFWGFSFSGFVASFFPFRCLQADRESGTVWEMSPGKKQNFILCFEHIDITLKQTFLSWTILHQQCSMFTCSKKCWIFSPIILLEVRTISLRSWNSGLFPNWSTKLIDQETSTAFRRVMYPPMLSLRSILKIKLYFKNFLDFFKVEKFCEIRLFVYTSLLKEIQFIELTDPKP